MIPRRIWQTWHTKLSPKMEAVVNTLKSQHPEFTHALYDISDCRAFLRENFDSHVLEAYDTLLPYAYKADLWRLCVLYIHGGIYLDVKFQCVGDFRLSELLDKEYYAKDLVALNISNGIMVCMPKNASLLTAINKIVQNVSIRYYGSSCLDITGPVLLKMLNVDCDLEFIHNYPYYQKFGHNYSYFLNGKKILIGYSSYYSDLLPNNHYTNAWKEKRVYRQNTLMLIAHPDDETLFGYSDLINASTLTVVCFTNGNNIIRSEEFSAVMAALNAKGIMLDYNDSLNDYWPLLSNETCLAHIPKGNYECVVSHNGFGEYGHKQHIRVNSIARYVAKALGLPFREFLPICDEPLRDLLLDFYVSQKESILQFRDWGLNLYK